MLEYGLYDNKLTADDPDDQVGRPVNVKINRRKDLVAAMTGEGSILKQTEIDAVLNNSWKRIAEFIRKGEAYSDDYFSTQFNITGVFIDKEDHFDPNRHTLTITAKLKGDVSSAVADVDLKKVDGNTIKPEITEVYNWGTNSYNDTLTPEDVLEISGSTLKIYNNLVNDEGVFFINQADGTEYRQTELRTNEPKTLTLRIPTLPAGNYRLEIRNTRHDGKVLRTGLFIPVLTVS